MDRAYWQQLADERVIDAKALLDAGRWAAAYYFVGYALECGLKACLLKLLGSQPEVIFRERRFSDKCWTHDIKDLMRASGLYAVWVNDTLPSVNPILEINRKIVERWNENSRYDQKTESEARDLFAAVTDTSDGVLKWIKSHW